uniref:Endoglin n=1 Tax=Amazona collaria TaxID=241587 RepID=A0A8B9IZL2_9PSIT
MLASCSRCRGGMCFAPAPAQAVLALQDARLDTGVTSAMAVSISEGPLLAWARDAYGGITSYSELRDPRWVQLRLGEDPASPLDCIPQEHFNATLHLETEVFFHGMKGCSRGDTQSTRAAHIIRLQPEPSFPITEVNLILSCPEGAMSNQILILQSWANITWSLSVNNCHIQFLVSGSYKIAPISSQLLPGELLPDSERGLVAKAFEKNYSVIASYSTIPASTRVSLEIQDHEAVRRVPVTPTAPSPTMYSLPHVLLLMLQPWKCTDETMEIVIARSHLEPIKDVVNITLRDISCQAEKNATHFMLRTPLSHCGTSLEGWEHAKNELILNLAKGAVLRSVRVAFQCKIPRELFLRLFPTAAFEAPQTELEVNKEAFVQASMRWEDHPADLQLKECWLAAPGRDPVLLVQGGEARGAGVAVLQGPPQHPRQEGLALPIHLRCPRGRPRALLRHAQVQGGLAGNPHPCDATAVVPTIGGGNAMGLSHPIVWWSPAGRSIPASQRALPHGGVRVSPFSRQPPPHRTTPSLRRSWR